MCLWEMRAVLGDTFAWREPCGRGRAGGKSEAWETKAASRWQRPLASPFGRPRKLRLGKWRELSQPTWKQPLGKIEKEARRSASEEKICPLGL